MKQLMRPATFSLDQTTLAQLVTLGKRQIKAF